MCVSINDISMAKYFNALTWKLHIQHYSLLEHELILIDHHFSLQRKYRQIILERVSRYKISNRIFFYCSLYL